MSVFFGTDGVRGKVGSFLTAELAKSLARAATQICRIQEAESRDLAKESIAGTESANSDRPRVLIIRDTRESGEMVEAAVAAGVCAAGGDAFLGGILPTPAAPLLIQRYKFDLGVVISASHNPYEDNGIKFFSSTGLKLSDATESQIEELVLRSSNGDNQRFTADGDNRSADGDNKSEQFFATFEETAPDVTGKIVEFHSARADYIEALHNRFGNLDLSQYKIVLDCANGATYQTAPEVFKRLGASVDVIYDQPDGRNINLGCGSTHTDALVDRMKTGEFQIGFAFDGDGDRVIAVDSSGVIADGDELIAQAAIHLNSRGLLPGSGVVVTVMANYGFHEAMKLAGINVATAQVGDRYVQEVLRQRQWVLGGEQSGHIIDMNFLPSGDGIACALLTLEALNGADLSERRMVRKLPQKLLNVRINDRSILDDNQVQRAIDEEITLLETRGRVLVRASGTEPLVRIMVEAPTSEEADSVCDRLAAVVRAVT